MSERAEGAEGAERTASASGSAKPSGTDKFISDRWEKLRPRVILFAARSLAPDTPTLVRQEFTESQRKRHRELILTAMRGGVSRAAIIKHALDDSLEPISVQAYKLTQAMERRTERLGRVKGIKGRNNASRT